MTQSATAGTNLYDTTSILRAFFEDALGTFKETEVDYLGKSLRWRFCDWPGTIAELYDIHKHGFTGTTKEFTQIASNDFHEGLSIVGRILNITDMHNMVADRPATEVPTGEPQAYRQVEASTVEDFGQPSSTMIQQELSRHIGNTINRLFELTRELYFEDGMETSFSQELVSLVEKYGNLAMSEIGYLITYARVDDEIASEALRWLGRINDPSTHGWRLWILEKSLSSESPMVRDSAGLGLVSMHDAHAIEYVKKAIKKETIGELRNDLQRALEELEASLDAASAKGDTQI